MIELDYQEIINLVVIVISVGFPIGLIFNISEMIVLTLMKMIFPKHFSRNLF